MNISSSKKFGILFFIVFLIVGLWPLLNSNEIRVWSIILAIIFLLTSLIKPSWLEPLNKLWIKFGELLGRFIAPIVMSIVFFLVLTPVSILVRIFKRDLLNLKFLKNKSTYWFKREKNVGPMNKQY